MRDARLQTVVSSGEEYSMISMQRLEDLMVPRFFWLPRSLFIALRIIMQQVTQLQINHHTVKVQSVRFYIKLKFDCFLSQYVNSPLFLLLIDKFII